MSMILATTWVRRGVAARHPIKYEVDDTELSRISKLVRLHLDDAKEDLKNAQDGDDNTEDDIQPSSESHINGETKNRLIGDDTSTKDDLKEYNLEDYDDEDDSAEGEKFNLFGNVGSLAYHAPHEEDPYLVLPEGKDESEEEREELEILPTDNLLLAAKVEDEVAHLEVMIYNDEAESLYVHHDMMLQAVPLCVEWINEPVGKQQNGAQTGNYVAVGTMDPAIEIFNLDIVDSMFPDAILGEELTDSLKHDSQKKSKKKRQKKANDTYHVDAVLALAANRQHRNLLASGSADQTLKLWDLKTTTCAKSYTMHTDKVTALDWNPSEATILLSGGSDQKVIATDMRAPEAKAPTWTVQGEVEKLRWNIHDNHYFFVTTDQGIVTYHDTRSTPSGGVGGNPIWTLQAHDSAVSSFDINPLVPDFIVTGSEDKKVKLWNVADNKPAMVISRNLEVGRVFSAQFAPDPEVAFTLSVAGSKGQVQIWDTSTNSAVRNVFSEKVKMREPTEKERIIAPNEDDGESDDDQTGAQRGMAVENDEGWESMDED